MAKIISKIATTSGGSNITSGSGNQTLYVTVDSTTGRSTAEESKTLTATHDGDLDTSAKDKNTATFKVIRTGKPVFLSGTDKTVTVENTGGTVEVTGTSNSGNIKLATTTTGKVISGVVASLQVRVPAGDTTASWTTDTGWNGTDSIALSSTAGTTSEYDWKITFSVPENKSESTRTHVVNISDGSEAGTEGSHQVAVTINQKIGVKYYSTPVLTLTYGKTKFEASADSASPSAATWVQYWKWNTNNASSSNKDGQISGTATDGTWGVTKLVDTENKISKASVSDGVVSVTTLDTNETSAVDSYLKVTWNVTFDRGGSGVKSATKEYTFGRKANIKTFNGASITGLTTTLPGSPTITKNGSDFVITLNPGVATTVDKTDFSYTVENAYTYSSGATDAVSGISSANYTIDTPGGVNASVTTTSKGLTATSSATTAGIMYLYPIITKDNSGNTINEPGTTSQITVMQAKNELIYDAVTWSVTTPVTLVAAGQTYSFTKNASQTYTSTADKYNNKTKASVASSSFTYSYSANNTQTGFSLNSSAGSVTATNNTSTVVRPSSTTYFTVTATATGLGGKSVSNTVNFNQSAGAKVYSNPEFYSTDTVTITPNNQIEYFDINYRDIHQDWTWNGVAGSGDTIIYEQGDHDISYNGYITWSVSNPTWTKITLDTSEGMLTQAAIGTETFSRTTNIVKGVITMNGKSSSANFTVIQEANGVKSYANPVVTGTVKEIPASGGSVASFNTINATQVATYTSGATKTNTITTSTAATSGTLSYSSAVTATNLTTNAKARTKVGTLTATVTANGKTGTKALDVYQQANLVYYATPVYTINPSTVINIGSGNKAGSYTINTSTQGASATKYYTSGSTTAVTPTLSTSEVGDGALTLSGPTSNATTVNIAANPTVNSRSIGTVKVTWTTTAKASIPSGEQSYLASNQAATTALAYANYTAGSTNYNLSFTQSAGNSILTVTPETQTVDYNGGTVKFTVTSNDSWTIS